MNARTLIGLATAATIAPTAMASYNTALTAAASAHLLDHPELR